MYSSPLHPEMRIGLVCFVLMAGYSSSGEAASFEKPQPPTTENGSQGKDRPPGKSSGSEKGDAEAKEEEMKGVVEKVIDGDSIKIRAEGGSEVYEVQIEGTDAPEAKQAYGPESTKALQEMVLGRTVRITWTKKDNFDRRLAQVYVGDEHINRKMIRDGHAWHFKRYNQSKELAQLEDEAKNAKRGLWGTEAPQAPWDYRKANKSPDKPDR